LGVTIEVEEALERHLNYERKMINTLEENRLELVKPWIRGILDYILTDEKRHHVLLERLLNLLEIGER
jgi:rubrerythrin